MSETVSKENMAYMMDTIIRNMEMSLDIWSGEGDKTIRQVIRSKISFLEDMKQIWITQY